MNDRPAGLQPLEVLLAGQAEFGPAGALAELDDAPLGFPEPCLYANFVASVDGLFLALSPLVAGRSAGQRWSLVEETTLLPRHGTGCTLSTLRQARSHHFSRYELPPAGQVGA